MQRVLAYAQCIFDFDCYLNSLHKSRSECETSSVMSEDFQISNNTMHAACCLSRLEFLDDTWEKIVASLPLASEDPTLSF